MFHLPQSSNKRQNDSIEGLISLGPGQSVGFNICSGLHNLDKFINLKYAPLVFELELAGSPGDCLNTGSFNGAAYSQSWKITEPQLKCVIAELDSELQNSYATHLLSGKRLPIHFSSYATHVQSATGKDNSLHVDRAFTRLKSVFVLMFRAANADYDKLLMISITLCKV